MVTGTPEEVAAAKTSHTGEFLRALVKPAPAVKKKPARRRKVAAAA
jgi:excinuclease ABC subunit A